MVNIPSSYISGKASIRVKPTIELPPRTTSLNAQKIILESPKDSILSFFSDDFSEIDLNDDISSNGYVHTLPIIDGFLQPKITTHSLNDISAEILSTLSLYRSKNNQVPLSSLTNGDASIIHQPNKEHKSIIKKQPHSNNRLSSMLSIAYYSFYPNKKTQSLPTSAIKRKASNPPKYLIRSGTKIMQTKSIILSS